MEFFYQVKNWYNNEIERQNAGNIAIQKLSERSRSIILPDKVNDFVNKIRYTQLVAIFALSAIPFVPKLSVAKKIFFVFSGGVFYFSWVIPYFNANFAEEIAEIPTDYGQAVRAIFLFKYPTGPKTSHYEKLSQDYRTYQHLKQIKNNS